MPGPEIPSRPCAICQRAAFGRRRYCPRCGKIIDRARISLPVALIIAALIEAYDASADAFRCYYSGVLLDTDRPLSPYFLEFDHADPGESRVVACARVINEMKKDLLESEFRIVVPALSDHMERGTQFDPNCIGFVKWKRAPVPIPSGGTIPDRALTGHVLPDRSLPSGMLPGRTLPGRTLSDRALTGCVLPDSVPRGQISSRRIPSGCHVCGGKRLPKSWYCARCRRLVRGGCHDNRIRQAALIDSFDQKQNGFLCRYTHVLLDDRSPKRPCSVSFDHRIPGGEEQVVCAYFVNCMKTNLTDTEFRAVLRELANHWRLGTPFDTGVIDAGRYGRAAARRRPPS